MWFARNFGYLFLVPGVGMLLGGFWSCYRIMSFRQLAGRAQGTVVGSTFKPDGDGGGSYHPEVEFAAPDGRVYRFMGKVGQAPVGFKTGERVPVLYDPDQPEKASIDTFLQQYFAPLLLSGLGLPFALAGGVPLYFQIRRRRLVEWLKINGQAVQAYVRGVERRTNIEVNGRNPYLINAEWTDSTNRIHAFQSESLWSDPEPHMPASKRVSVLVDPNDPKRYWMDLTFLPKPD